MGCAYTGYRVSSLRSLQGLNALLPATGLCFVRGGWKVGLLRFLS